MKLVFVVPRYGSLARGLAPERSQALAERLVLRGHVVEVLTTRALDPVTFEPVLPEGAFEENGVRVRRLAASGAAAPQLLAFLNRRGAECDAAVFVSHEAWTTTHGLPAARIPAFLLPAEALPRTPAAKPLARVLGLAAAVLLDVAEEATLLESACPGSRGALVGYGAEIQAERKAVGEDLRGLRPYVLLPGPLAAADGCAVVVEQFLRVQREGGSRLTLVLEGRGRIELHESVHVRQLREMEKGETASAMAGALAILVPSRQSVLPETLVRAWSVGRPVLVSAGNDVLRRVVERSGGGLAYRGSSELGAALRLLEADPGLADALGRQGAQALAAEHAWPGVLDRCEVAFTRIRARGRSAA